MAGGDRRGADAALIAALAGGATIQAAARQAGLSERTVHRRLDEPDFRMQLDHARGELVSGTVGQLAAAGTAAVATLVQLLQADAATVRLGASRAILELGLRLREAEELERRVRALEDQADERRDLGAGGGPWLR